MRRPVLNYELILSTRRGRHHRYRLVYAAWLVLWLLILASVFATPHMFVVMPADQFGIFCLVFAGFMGVQQSCLIWLAAPAFAAGTITEEKTRGTMLYLLTTELTAWEILRDKLISKVCQIGLIALGGLPLIVGLGVIVEFGYVQWLKFALALPQLVGLVAAGMLASVCIREISTALK